MSQISSPRWFVLLVLYFVYLLFCKVQDRPTFRCRISKLSFNTLIIIQLCYNSIVQSNKKATKLQITIGSVEFFSCCKNTHFQNCFDHGFLLSPRYLEITCYAQRVPAASAYGYRLDTPALEQALSSLSVQRHEYVVVMRHPSYLKRVANDLPSD